VGPLVSGRDGFRSRGVSRTPRAEVARWLAQRRVTIGALLIMVAGWELVGQLRLVAGGAFPPLSDVVREIWQERAVFPAHIRATLTNASIGFVLGNLGAIGLALLFLVLPATERILRGTLVALFCAPLIIVAPILAVSLGGDDAAKIALAALAVYFPTLVGMLVGLRQVDPAIIDVVHTAGGSNLDVLLRVRLRASIPGLLAGLRLAAPAALLGAILGEFLGGTRGLGIYLLGSLGTGDPARLWAISLVATAIALIGYGVFALLGSRFTSTTVALSLASQAAPESTQLRRTGSKRWWANLGISGLAILVPFVLWIAWIKGFHLPSTFAKGPAEMWEYLVSSSASGANRAEIWEALIETLTFAGLGLLCGLVAAFLFAVVLSVRPELAHAILPLALILQATPLVVLTPVLVLVFGRGILATIVISVSVIFFAAFVVIAQGLASVPTTALDLMRSYNASVVTTLRKVSIPAAMPYLFAAARLSVPRALLAVIISEYLATGRGLGFLLLEARGSLRFSMLWAIAFVVVVISVLLYELVALAERKAAVRFG
jgi:sulfonate transport system permease protein